ncbi:polysaccharide biosynthesis tyrosine autokinase [Streptomyces sp. NPDC096198]|uniref:polysaccharide biosynthesis tyrosine autokinase n=1 Tax=Streptomyces sp. NPDC096198 TaxID=3366080 RepID=UPI00381E648C
MTALGTGAGILDSALATPEYRATATVFISVHDGGDANQLFQGNAFVRERARSYLAVASGPVVTGAVVDALRLHMRPAQLADHITAVAPAGTVLVRLTVSDSSAARAALIGNAVADRFVHVVTGMERAEGPGPSPVRLAVVQPAAVPAAPVSPGLAADAALALAVSLLVGTALGVALERLDTAVRDAAALAECLASEGGPAVLAVVAEDPRAVRAPVSLCRDPNGPRAEDFRRLRVNLRFAEVDRRPKVIAVTSPLPREGRSSVSLHLAAALAEQGSKVCLVDCDLRRPSLARALGLDGDTGLTTALLHRADPRGLLQSAGSFSVLTSGAVPPDPPQLLGGNRFRSLLRALAEEFDHVLVDTPAVLPFADTTAMAPAVDGHLLVARAGRTGRSQVADALSTLRRTGVPVLGAVLNADPEHGRSRGYGYGHRPAENGTVARIAALAPSYPAAAASGDRRAAGGDEALVRAETRP